MRKWLYSDALGRPNSFGVLVLRLVMGTAFLFHGWPKIQHPFGWTGPDADMPGVLQSLAALSEFGGGLALILGLLDPGLPASGLGGRCFLHWRPCIFRTVIRSWENLVRLVFELPAVYLAFALLLLLVGAGRFSLDALLFSKPIGPECRTLTPVILVEPGRKLCLK